MRLKTAGPRRARQTVGVLMLTLALGACEEEKVLNSDAVVRVSWAPNAEAVLGYEVYYGESANTADQLVADVSFLDPDFDLTAPQVDLVAGVDLNVARGDPVCIRVKAYDETSLSDYSDPVCGRVPR